MDKKQVGPKSYLIVDESISHASPEARGADFWSGTAATFGDRFWQLTLGWGPQTKDSRYLPRTSVGPIIFSIPRDMSDTRRPHNRIFPIVSFHFIAQKNN